ncbi:MAG: hypothetical protein HOP30_00680 [Cyclobacteriaceae bacterium]|nr:hypothetical protein [Cyclobacteriaceae bacterium]
MVITINKGERKLKSLPEAEGFQAFKFLGKVKVDGDGLSIQKQMRNGWKERIR